MRAGSWIAIVVIAYAPLFASSHASADPKPASAYSVELIRKPGAIFAGLARDGDELLVTDLGNGRLFRRGSNGVFTAFGPTLPHGLDVIGDPTGPYQIARYGGDYLVTQGWTPVGEDEGPYDHAMLEVDNKSVVNVISSDFLNPFDFTISGDVFYVIDAARNSVERLAQNGGKTTVFTFARLSQPEAALKHLSPTEFGNKSNYEFDAVPTGIVALDDRLYVSLFAGFPFIAGSGRVVSLPRAGETPLARVEVVDLNAPVDVATDGDTRLLVLEHGIYDETRGFLPGSGRLLSIDLASGERRVILDDLTRPAAVLVFDEHEIVVSQLDGTLVILTRQAK
jgi:hypothetical protein